ncbi:hypothetical protein DFH06DRAFT_1224340 [Mycena polygramma]|nr:hypothetical protein DFH06DRAFT_1224340 [Mycena polygramma]
MAPAAVLSALPSDKSVDPSTISRDILDTNDPPADFNISSIREFVSRGSARRAVLDSKIAPLKAELKKLVDERNALDTEIRKHEGAISPLRRLPTEVICIIFTLALPPFAYSSNVMNVHEGPWVLSAVCSRWRTIALSQPCFWTHLSLDFTNSPPESPSLPALLPTLEAQLERSQQSPLHVTFRTFYEMDIEEREQRVLDLIMLHCDRWETIDFTVPWMLFTSPCFEDIRDELPLLSSLDISVQEFDDDLGSVFDVFQSCPRLEEVYFNAGCYGEDHAIVADLPFSQLRRYSASNSWANHALVLHSASNLVDCVLRVIPPAHSMTGRAIALPHLLRLSVSTNAFLDLLDAPVLQELYCCDQSDHLYPFLARLPKLQKLVVVAETASALEVAHLLHAALTITTLCLYLPTVVSSDLFSILENPDSDQDGNAQRIPRLQVLSLCLVSTFNEMAARVDQDHLIRALESQRRNGCLRSLKLYGTTFRPSTITLERMELLRGHGIDIRLFERSDTIYRNMVPSDFQLYSDHNGMYDMLFRSTME